MIPFLHIAGQGADEIFGGYAHLRGDYLREQDQCLPNTTPSKQWRADEQKKADEAASAGWTGEPIGAKYLNSGIAPRSMDEAPDWLKYIQLINPEVDYAPWTQCLGSCPPEVTLMEDISESVRQLMIRKWHPLHSALYVWNKTILPNKLLSTLSDRTEMSNSVEGRVPFLDHHLIDYVNNLPPSMKFRYDPVNNTLTEKWILKEASKPFITQELYERTKQVSLWINLTPEPGIILLKS